MHSLYYKTYASVKSRNFFGAKLFSDKINQNWTKIIEVFIMEDTSPSSETCLIICPFGGDKNKQEGQ